MWVNGNPRDGGSNLIEYIACCVLARRVGDPIVDVSALVEA